VKLFLIGMAQGALTILIVLKFGWIGLLISLPFIAALAFGWHWAKGRWERHLRTRLH
jgi:hypothetical protein